MHGSKAFFPKPAELEFFLKINQTHLAFEKTALASTLATARAVFNINSVAKIIYIITNFV